MQLSLSNGLNVCVYVRCAEQRTSCDACVTQCARNMQTYRGSHRCNVTADDADNGQSPRLAYCFSCCGVEECSELCGVYRSTDCRQTRYTRNWPNLPNSHIIQLIY